MQAGYFKPMSMPLRLLPLLLTGCIELDRPLDSGAAFSDYTGWERYLFGSGPGELNCDLYWTATGSPSLVACPECVFTFDLLFVQDSAQSKHDGTCHMAQESFSETYVLIEEAGEYSVGTWNSGVVSVFASAD
ncbi:MAG: hypothetical protein ACI8RZ_006750, partial [Myxococcota bacterium]